VARGGGGQVEQGGVVHRRPEPEANLLSPPPPAGHHLREIVAEAGDENREHLGPSLVDQAAAPRLRRTQRSSSGCPVPGPLRMEPDQTSRPFPAKLYQLFQ